VEGDPILEAERKGREWQQRHPGDQVWRLIAWELEAQAAMGMLGPNPPDEETLHVLAHFILATLESALGKLPRSN
jgi:hypothetical protein